MDKRATSAINPREKALHWLFQVIIKGRSVNALVTDNLAGFDPQQKAFAKQLLFGCLRYYHQLSTLANNLLHTPLKNKDADLFIVILLGLYQIKYLSIPDHAAISESVELTKQFNKAWASGLINGVLRRYQRESTTIEKKLSKSLQFQFSHPGWIVKRIQKDWPNEFKQILKNNNRHAPMVLRVNTIKTSRKAYHQRLSALNIALDRHPVAPNAVILPKPVDVTQLPGFSSGDVTVQDAAAQLAVELMDLKPLQNVLDGCAAPGGKTTHLLQKEQVNLTAVEVVPKRAATIQTTLDRLNLSCNVICSDILAIENWWNGKQFDRILLDVPCSASGVIRRNPDIKIHRKVTDLKPIVTLQKTMLNKIWPLLKPGGILVYATCSVFKEENEQQIERFLTSNKAQLVIMPPQIHQQLSNRASVGYQILPGEQQMDGFFLCGLKKQTS